MNSPRLNFTLEKKCAETQARAATFATSRGSVTTPTFMPVATHAVLRGQSLEPVAKMGTQVLLANTYHLLLRPGPEIFKTFGGIHQFMVWPGLVLTDSGGFQLFSLSAHRKMSEEGAAFRSYIDGEMILLSPEISIATQRAINSDIMMVLDNCVPSTSDRKTTEEALHLTHRWAKRSLAAREDSPQCLFGIVQGGCFHDLRKISAEQITALPFDGYAVGGVAVGEERSIRDDIVAYTTALLPQDRPRYLMGVGTPIDLLEGVARGIDMFDCIIPTALAAQGRGFTYTGKVNLGRAVYAGSTSPLDETCGCSTCLTYSRGYLHHLFKTGEHLGNTLLGIHNLFFYRRLTIDMREAILKGEFPAFYRNHKERLAQSEVEFPVTRPKPRAPLRNSSIGDYELHTRDGSVSVKQISSGEVMHSVSAPSEEAERLYIAQSGFRKRLRALNKEPLVIWDVGLGAATNAMAVIDAFEAFHALETEPTNQELGADPNSYRHVQLISFENDLDSLRLALKNPWAFPHIRHAAPNALLRDNVWKHDHLPIRWELLLGDFKAKLADAAAPHLIFFDPFSYKTNPDLWTLETFELVFGRSIPGGTSLYTYSASTAVRAGLLAAGFSVGLGVSTGPKSDTTVAYRLGAGELPQDLSATLLTKDWLGRWERSDNRLPIGLPSEDAATVMARIRTHPQFMA